jgi:hypothetical protein
MPLGGFAWNVEGATLDVEIGSVGNSERCD